jgi:signal peptidase I
MIGAIDAVMAVGVALVVALVLVRRRFMIVTVEGPSMEPALAEGDVVLVGRCTIDAVRRGHIVVLLGPRMPALGLSASDFLAGVTNNTRPLMIKRVAALPGDPIPGQDTRVPRTGIFVIGDNPDASYDSRQAGPFDAGEIRGVVLRTLAHRRRTARSGHL